MIALKPVVCGTCSEPYNRLGSAHPRPPDRFCKTCDYFGPEVHFHGEHAEEEAQAFVAGHVDSFVEA